MRGRRPSGPEFVVKLEGSDLAKQRLRVLLETVAGTCRVLEACERLQISEQRLDQLRIGAWQAALEWLELKPVGRKPKHNPYEEEIRQLHQRIAELEAELKAARARAEIAVALPRLGRKQPVKKTTVRRQRRSSTSKKHT